MNLITRKAKDSDYNFAFEIKKQAIGPHITSKWGWDEEFQLNIHHQRWNEKPWLIIMGLTQITKSYPL